MGQPKKYEVLIVGGGLAGLSTALHLKKRGAKSVLVIDRPQPGDEKSSLQTMGMVSGGQLDNFSRVSVAHGAGFAADLWRFGDQGFDALRAFCGEQSVAFAQNRRLRLIVSEHELTECRQAVKEMHAAGLPAVLQSRELFAAQYPALSPRVLAIQDDGQRAAYCDAAGLLQKLRTLTAADFLAADVAAVQTQPGPAEVLLTSGERLTAEVVVLTTHLATAGFLPTIADAFVAVAEQWSVWQIAEAADLFAAGVVFSANHGLELGVTVDANRVHFGGARYLRPLAGIGAAEAAPLGKITDHLGSQLSKTFNWGKTVHAVATTTGRDCRPCDELPVIGPMFGEMRLLCAAGFMGSGLGMGFFAGQCLAELIATGKCAALPPRLAPARLRTLEH